MKDNRIKIIIVMGIIMYVFVFSLWSYFEYQSGYFRGHREGYKQALEENFNVNLEW